MGLHKSPLCLRRGCGSPSVSHKTEVQLMVPGGIGHYSYYLPRLCPRVGPTLLSLTKPVSNPSFIYLLAVPHGLWDLRILVP